MATAWITCKMHQTEEEQPTEGGRVLFWAQLKSGGWGWVYGAVSVQGDGSVAWGTITDAEPFIVEISPPEWWAEWPTTNPNAAPRVDTLKVQPPKQRGE